MAKCVYTYAVVGSPEYDDVKKRQEVLLETAIRNAELLGYDRSKIVRVPWLKALDV